MLAIHPNARTTPAVRAEIARSHESSGVLAQRYGVSTETIRKGRKRGPADCQDHASRPHKLPWTATEEERAIVCALRRATGFPLDDLTFVVTHFLPHASRSRKPNGTFKDDDLGFVHGDVKPLPKLRTQDGQSRKRDLDVAIDRASRFVHLAVRDDETERSAVAFLKEAVQAFPFQVTHGLTDRGSCFTADGFEAACRKLGVTHRKTRPDTPRTNGMVERFNQAYNARRQRVLKGRSPDRLVRERLSAAPARANRSHDPPFDPCILPKALQVIARAKDVSHPNMIESWRRYSHSVRPHASLGYRPPAPGVFVPAFAAWPAALTRPAPRARLLLRSVFKLTPGECMRL